MRPTRVEPATFGLPAMKKEFRVSKKSHDYVIVGAGSAGCVLAARLSEDPATRVLLIEAGPVDDDPALQMPIAWPTHWMGRFDWDLASSPEPGLGYRDIHLVTGRGLGGTSSVNAMIYIRGDRRDYDEWAADGAEGWSYDEVLPYFRRSEDNERGEDGFHGAGGPLAVSDTRSRNPLVQAFLDAAIEAGVPRNHDVNGADQEGVDYFQTNQRDGRRCSAAKGYLHPAMGRPNLEVLTEARALRLLFEGDRAIGVETHRHGKVDRHIAEAEVLLCAGTYQSPKLLLLSGIGPADELSALGIEAVLDLPVGEGLQDHLLTLLVFGTEMESLLTAFTPENVALFEEHGTGPLTSNLAEGGGFIRSHDAVKRPDFQILGVPVLYRHGETVTEHGVSIAGCQTKPLSRGRVSLRTADPFTKPRVVHNFYVEEDDRRVVREGFRRMLEISDQPAFQAVVTGPDSIPASRSDADIDAFVSRYGGSGYHPVGTCAIGSVVDPDLRVKGVDGLRVIDASVMPSVPRGNTNAPTIMIAERGADLVRKMPRPGPVAAETPAPQAI
jgi:choline dehydrogenase